MNRIEKVEAKVETWVEKKPLSMAIWAILTTFGICILVTVILVLLNITHIGNFMEVTKTGSLGDTFNGLIGPFIALLVAILTFLAFYIQFKANEMQNKINKAQDQSNEVLQFESKFFELIKLHRNNVSELTYNIFTHKEDKVEDRVVFKEIFSEFLNCLKEVRNFSATKNPDDYIRPAYKDVLNRIIREVNPNINLYDLATIDIAYCIVFYGVENEGEIILRKIFLKKYTDPYFHKLINYLQIKPKKNFRTEYDCWNKINDLDLVQKGIVLEEFYNKRLNPNELEQSKIVSHLISGRIYDKYYGGHQYRLGHYFRHLFQSYKFLNSQKVLDEEQKYFYGKTLRAQLSTYEQALLLVNSLSSLGMKWEYRPDYIFDEEISVGENNELREEQKLITKYNLIKNLPGDRYLDIKYSDYYPNVKFEFNEQ